MAPPTIDLEPYRDYITQAVSDKVPHATVRQHLEQEHGVVVSSATLTRTLRRWQIRSAPVDLSPLNERISYMFFELRLSDAQTVAILKDEGLDISQRRVKSLRHELGLMKKVPKELHEMDNMRITELLRQEYLTGGVNNFGKERLYQHMRSNNGLVGRNRVYQAARRLMPESFERRRHRQDKVVLPKQAFGPNHIWSMDAHCKFEEFGMTIYGAIDVYSRFVVWLHVGVAAKTSTSVLAQYLRCLEAEQIMPEIIQVDGGFETTQMGNAHLTLSNEVRIRPGEQLLTVDDVFRIGTSKQNQRIERYWGEQARGALNEWRQYFLELQSEQLYNKANIADKIAFLAVYMPIIRSVVQAFMLNHNKHRIRKQKNRPNAVEGIPEILYYHPRLSKAEPYGFTVPASLLRPWQEQLENFDMEEYLPPTTLDWCESSLRGCGFQLPLSPFECDARFSERIHRSAYIQLRSSVQRHMDNVNDPVLEESYMPYAADWTEVLHATTLRTAAAHGSFREAADDMSYLPPN